MRHIGCYVFSNWLCEYRPTPPRQLKLMGTGVEHPKVTKVEIRDAGAKLHEVRQLLHDADSVLLHLPSKAALEHAVAEHSSWSNEVSYHMISRSDFCLMLNSFFCLTNSSGIVLKGKYINET